MNESGADVTFVGAAAAEDLDLYEAGYSVEGGDTVLRIRMDDVGYLEIAFETYTGGLTSDELTFA